MLLAAGAFAADQATKLVVVRSFVPGQSIPLVGELIALTYVLNPGGVFGIRLGSSFLHTLLACLALGLVGVLLARHHPTSRIEQLGFSLILGGAAGNLIDRFRLGHVVDFIDCGVGDYRWPVFNAADIWVTCGAAALVVAHLWGRTAGHGDTDRAA